MPGCQFVLGFERLHTLIPQVVGDCLWNEMHLANGDGTQVTANGLLTWRKATNLTAFTNGEAVDREGTVAGAWTAWLQRTSKGRRPVSPGQG